MRKEVREAAQMYGLLSIGLKDLLDVCETVSEVKEAIDYAEDFGEQYDFWCEMQYKKHQEIEEAWSMFSLNTINEACDVLGDDDLPDWHWESYYSYLDTIEKDYNKAEAERHNPYYTEEELQDAFDVFCTNRKNQIIRIGKEARKKGIEIFNPIIGKFFRAYRLSSAEAQVFWLAYYGTINAK